MTFLRPRDAGARHEWHADSVRWPALPGLHLDDLESRQIWCK